MTLTDASGQIFRGDGSAMSLLGYADGGGNIYYSSVTGAFEWTAAPVTSWLHEGDSAGITVYAQDYPIYDVRLVQIQGSVQVEEKSGLFAVAFDPIGTLFESGPRCGVRPRARRHHLRADRTRSGTTSRSTARRRTENPRRREPLRWLRRRNRRGQ
jgi:hypothetical protein